MISGEPLLDLKSAAEYGDYSSGVNQEWWPSQRLSFAV
jgi:hypothetical protein